MSNQMKQTEKCAYCAPQNRLVICRESVILCQSNVESELPNVTIEEYGEI